MTLFVVCFFFFKQKTAYEMRISDWSSDVCSSDLTEQGPLFLNVFNPPLRLVLVGAVHIAQALVPMAQFAGYEVVVIDPRSAFGSVERFPGVTLSNDWRSEEHTSELQSLMRISYAVLCLKKKKYTQNDIYTQYEQYQSEN